MYISRIFGNGSFECQTDRERLLPSSSNTSSAFCSQLIQLTSLSLAAQSFTIYNLTTIIRLPVTKINIFWYRLPSTCLRTRNNKSRLTYPAVRRDSWQTFYVTFVSWRSSSHLTLFFCVAVLYARGTRTLLLKTYGSYEYIHTNVQYIIVVWKYNWTYVLRFYRLSTSQYNSNNIKSSTTFNYCILYLIVRCT